MTLLGLIGWTNQIGVGTVITIIGFVGAVIVIRSNLAGLQANQIRALERQVDTQKRQLKDAEKEASEIRTQLAEERAKTDLSAVTTLLKNDLQWKQAELGAIRASIEQGRQEHIQIVAAMESIKSALEVLVSTMTPKEES